MAWIIQNKEEMASMLESKISDLQSKKAVALILPLLRTDSDSDVEFVLREQRKYLPSVAEEEDGRVGALHLSTKRNALDALFELTHPSMLDVHSLMTAFDCRVEPKDIGNLKTMSISTAITGQFFVDVETFAQKLNLPLSSDLGNSYAVFIEEVKNPDGTKRRVLVAIQEEKRDPNPSDSKLDSLSTLLLQQKNRAPWDIAYKQNLPEFTDGWQLKTHPRFNDVLSSFRCGYGYFVTRDENGSLVVAF